MTEQGDSLNNNNGRKEERAMDFKDTSLMQKVSWPYPAMSLIGYTNIKNVGVL
jgi:hypothetical protein